MKLLLTAIFLGVFTNISAQRPQPPGSKNNTICCLPGAKGLPGERGDTGERGNVGKVGDPGQTYFSSCPDNSCPPGSKGSKGSQGWSGFKGFKGNTGDRGPRGPPGFDGPKGQRGPPGPANDAILFLPYLPNSKSENVCYSFNRYCYVPGIASGWRAWYRKGKSGFLVHRKWMYYVTLSRCSCKYEQPDLPQPCDRLGNCN